MTGVRLPSVLAGATALALLMGSAALAQQAIVQQPQNAQGVAAPSQNPQATADASQTRGAATQILQQIEAIRLALEQGQYEDARELLDQINIMAQQAAASGEEAEMLPIQAQVQQAVTALLSGNIEATLAALDDAALSMKEVEQSAAAEAAAPRSQQQAPAQSSASEQSARGRVVVHSPGPDVSGQGPAAQLQEADGQAATQAARPAGHAQATGVDQQALRDAQSGLEMARRDIEAALRSVEQAEAALARAAGDGRSGRVSVIERQSSGDESATGNAPAPAKRGEVPRLNQEETLQLLGIGERQVREPSEMLAMTAGDMRARKVVTFDGRSLGEIDRIVSNGGALYAIIEHGGFLGIGESRVAVPADRLGIRGEEIVLLGLSEEQLNRMPDYDLGAGQELGQEQPIEIGRYN